MTKITANGVLTKTEERYAGRFAYRFAITRKSGTVDTLLVLSETGNLTEGPVKIEGSLHASYIHAMKCVPVVIYPDNVKTDEDNGYSESEVTGTLKETPVCRKTKGGFSIASVLIITDDGPVPVLVWGEKAEEAVNTFKAGDKVSARGRLQSREYPSRDGNSHVTYELSSKGLEPVPDK